MTQDPQIRRHPDGSIDMSHYLGKGRDCRSRAALELVARGKGALGKSFGKVDGNRWRLGRRRRLQPTSVKAT